MLAAIWRNIWRKIRFWVIAILALAIFTAGAYVSWKVNERYHQFIDQKPALKWFLKK